MKKIIQGTIFLILILLLVTQSFAEVPPGFNRIGVLYLFEKEPQSNNEEVGPWPIVYNGAWGKMTYNLWGPTFDFVFHGRRLQPSTDYTLIYYPDPWPGNGLICLGSGRSNKAGNLLIFGRVDIGTNLPADYDANWTPCGDGPPANCLSGAVGAKIWLVLSSDVDCLGLQDQAPHMINWNPEEYLFEYNLINFQLRDAHGKRSTNKK